MASHSVQFPTDTSNVDFDLIAFADISGSMTSSFTFKDIFYQQGFTGTDSSATATIDIAASELNGLFKLNVPVFDPAVGAVDVDRVRYLTKPVFPDISFSEAEVDTGAIFTSHSDQTIKKDYLRSMLKDITGTTRLNNLFKNQNTMISHIQSLDSSFNAAINNVLTSINSAGWLTDADYGDLSGDGQTYTFDGVFAAYSYEDNSMSAVDASYTAHSITTFSKFNPLRILSSSILGEEDADSGDNDTYDISGTGLGNSARREMLIDALAADISTNWNGDFATNTYSAVNSAGTSYRVAVTEAAATADGNMDLTNDVMNGSVFSTYLSNLNVYAVEAAANTATGGSLLDNVIDKEYDLEFIAGDKLHLLVTYKPQSSTYSLLSSSPAVNERTYEIILNMTA